MSRSAVVLEVAQGTVRSAKFAPFLASDAHPLLEGGRILSMERAGDLLTEFAHFSHALPVLLTKARKACTGTRYAPLRGEIELNLREELGVTGAKKPFLNQSHYSLLRGQILLYFGRDPELEVPRNCTHCFLSGLARILGAGGASTYGALLALEATAVPEINTIRLILDRAFKQRQIKWTPTLAYFFAAHVSKFEVDHYQRLCALHETAISGRNELAKANSAFLKVVAAMRAWYFTLSSELLL